MDDGRDRMLGLILHHFLDTVYSRPVTDFKSESKRYEALSSLVGEDAAETFFPGDGGGREYPHGYRLNDAKGVTGAPPPRMQNYQAVRRILQSLCEKGVLVRCGSKNARNRVLYLPEESTDGCLALVRTLPPQTGQDGPLCASAYAHMVLDRQLVLDVLRRNGVTVTVSLESPGTGTSYPINSALVGRYLRVYEDQGPFMDFQDRLMRLSDTLSQMDEGEVFLALYPEAREGMVEGGSLPDRTGCKEANLAYLEHVIDVVDSFLGDMQRMEDAAGEDGLSSVPMEDRFSMDPGNRLRRESWASGLHLTDAEREALVSLGSDCVASHYGQLSARGEAVRPAECEEESWYIGRWFADGYPQFVDEEIVLPILALITLSPSARRRFLLEGEEWSRGCNTFVSDSKHVRCPLLTELFRLAAADLLQGRGDIGADIPVRYAASGNVTVEGKGCDSLMSFKLEDGRVLVFYGGHKNRLPGDADDRVLAGISPLVEGMNARVVGRKAGCPALRRLMDGACRFRDFSEERLWRVLCGMAEGHGTEEDS